MKEITGRKRDIMDSFISFYMYHEVSEITVRQVCDKIHLSRTSFYHYYEDLDDVLNRIKEDVIGHLSELNQNFYMLDLQTCDENQYRFLLGVLKYIRQNEQYFKALLRHRESDDFYVRWGEIIKRDFKKKYYYAGKRVQCNNITLELTAAAVIGVYEYWLYHLNEIQEKDLIRVLYDHLCTAFKEESTH